MSNRHPKKPSKNHPWRRWQMGKGMTAEQRIEFDRKGKEMKNEKSI